MHADRKQNKQITVPRPPVVWMDMLVIFGIATIFFVTASYLELSEEVSRVTDSMEAWQLDELPLVLLVIFILMAGVLVHRTRQLRKQIDLQIEAQKKLTFVLDQNRRLTRKNIEIPVVDPPSMKLSLSFSRRSLMRSAG